MPSIIIADSHNLFREALCSYLRYADPDLKIGGAGDYETFRSLLDESDADIVLIDAGLPGWDGNVRDITRENAKMKCGLILPLLQGEITDEPDIDGVFPRSLSCKAFMGGIASILEGRTFFPSLKENATALDMSASRKTIQDFHLTGREKEVLSHLVKGASNKDIARALDLQVVTVKLHVRGVCRKMKAANRTQAALMAKEHGWG